jgi:hypothetical protein
MLEIGSREFQYWQEYYKQEPFGDDWDQAAMLAAVGVNKWSKRKVKMEQFKPFFKSMAKRDPQELKVQLMQWVLSHNARVDAEEKKKRGS